jgi:signal transduction histidine kinase/ligand-binding sensor domain-containing protein
MHRPQAKCRSFFPAIIAVFVFSLPIFAERLPVRIFTSADGLGSSFVDFLYRDSRGFMWFCTRDGLSRFDGSQFVTYDIGDEDSPPGIENIYETNDGMYWISTTGGIYRFDPSKISQPEGDRPRLNAEKITRGRGLFLQDRNGVLWLASAGLNRLENVDGKPTFVKVELNVPPRPETGFATFDLAESDDGSLWIQTSWGLIRRLPDERSVFYPHESFVTGGEIEMIADRSGRIWITYGNELFVLKPEPIDAITETEKVIFRKFAPTRALDIEPLSPVGLPRSGGEIFKLQNKKLIEPWPTKRLLQTSDGSVWVGGEAYLLQFSDGSFNAFSNAQGLPSMIGRLGEDSAGNLWIGGQATLARLDRSGLITYDASDGLRSSRFFSITEDDTGILYFGLPNFEIAAYENGQFRSVRPNIPITAKRLWTSRFLFRSTSGDFWILTNQALYRFSNIGRLEELDGRSPSAVYNSSNGLRSDGAFQIFEDSRGDIWVSTRGSSSAAHGLARMKKGENVFRPLTEAEGLPIGKAPSSFAEDRVGNIWMGFYDGGLGRFDGERFQVFSNDDGVPESGIISDLHTDQKGRVWLASSNFGIFRIDDISSPTLKLHRIGTEQGLHSTNVRTLTEDRFGRIYAGTARGVDRISPDTLNIKHYSVMDGLASDFVVDSHRDKNGDLWFVTNNGASRYTPKPEERSPAPEVFIGGLRISGILQPVAQLGETFIERADLGHTENNIQISFFGLDFKAGENLRFQYKLEDADEDWGQPTEATTITYANLVPGNYTFSVRAVNSEGTVSDSPARISISILPPLWQRWWFILGTAVFFLGAGIMTYQYRTARLREVNRALNEARGAEEQLRRAREERLAELEKVRARIATDLHDDIGASLTQIAVLSEVAQTKAMAGNGAALEPLTRISDVSNQLVGTMSDIVWSINPAKDHLSDLTQRMRRFASDLLSPRNVGFSFVTPEASNEIVVSSNTRREVFLIFKESINNIVKHSSANNVRLELAIDGDELLFRITDDGSGFLEGENDSSIGGNGIASMRRRAALMGARLDIKSEQGAGTSITLHVPLVDATHA